jgi:uncharacterized membrane protein
MRILNFCLGLLFSVSAIAQDSPYSLKLSVGDVIKVNTDLNSTNTSSMMGGDPMESKTISNSYTELKVTGKTDSTYTLTQTLVRMKLDFEGFGQKMNFDSESKEKQENPFAKQIMEKIGQAEEIIVSLNGEVIEPVAAKEKEGKSRGGAGKGMMRMMSGGGASAAETAFLVVPQKALTEGVWETTNEKDGLTTKRRYTLGAVMGNMATITVQSQTKGDIDMSRNGMQMTSKVNTLSEDMILVDLSSGKVQMHTAEMTNNSKTFMNGQESPSSGKTTISSTFQ